MPVEKKEVICIKEPTKIKKLNKTVFEVSREEAMKLCKSYIPEETYLFMFYDLCRMMQDEYNAQFLRSEDYYYFSFWENNQKKVVKKYAYDDWCDDFFTVYDFSECDDFEEQPEEPVGSLSAEEINDKFRIDTVFRYFDLFVEVIKTVNENGIVLFDKCPAPYSKDGFSIVKQYGGFDNCGAIYVMKNCNYFKIGKAKKNSSRYGEYTKLPEEPIYLIKREDIFDYSNVEKIIHIIFRKKRNRNGNCEWFSLNEEDIKKIDMILDLFSLEKKNGIDRFNGELLWKIESIL